MITIVLSYFENGGMLDRHLTEWQSYAPYVKEQFRAVIVDDCSEKDPAASHMRDVGFPVELYRILPPKIIWNTPGARNLGAHVAPDDWMLLTDVDHLLEADQAERLHKVIFTKNDKAKDFFRLLIEKSEYEIPEHKICWFFQRIWADGRPLHPHPNSMLLHRRAYWEIGGTDEDWSGWWGAGEQVFRKCLQTTVFNASFQDIYLTHFGRDDIPDASTREWGRKNSAWDWRNNPALVEKAKRAPYKPERPLRFEWERVL